VKQKSSDIIVRPEGDVCRTKRSTIVLLTPTEGVSILKGIAQVIDSEMITTTQEVKEVANNQSMGENVRQSLRQYFSKLDGQTPANLYGLVLAEVEKPLLEMVLQLTNGNQSKAAIILGLSRGTLRKKMAIYGLL
jgi:Fis family transcriptional regulator